MKPEYVENAQNYPTIRRDGKTWAPAEFAGKMQLAILNIRKLHKEVPGRSHEETTCEECYRDYPYYEYVFPCPTIKALDSEQ